jgi:Ca2+-binding EF-hand superfamily protein
MKGGPDMKKRGPGSMPGMTLMLAMDKNHDHKLSKEELASAGESLAKLDANRDGEITVIEMMTYGRKPGPQQSAPRKGPRRGPAAQGQRGQGPDKDRKSPMPQRRPRGPGADSPARRPGAEANQGGNTFRPDPEVFYKRIMQADKDGDGKLTKEEMPGRMQAMFDRFDTNGDGSTDVEEMKAHFKKMSERFKQGPGRGGEKKSKDKEKSKDKDRSEKTASGESI